MIPKECKRLAEVDFPIAEVSRHAVREKSIRHGHPSTLHLWWARRPLASCRAMLLALLLPDPCDQHCPMDFNEKAREILGGMFPVPDGDEGLRKALLKFIGDVANWDVANNQRWIGVARDLVKAANPEETPLVVDPFAGGGSIPLEALRLGCDAFASDLNPVACLILKVLLEDIPRHGPELAEELRRAGRQIKEQAEKELKEFYPDDPDGAKPIAYLWARTVRCEAPNCGAEIPLARSFWLCKKANRKRALRYRIVRTSNAPPTVEFEIFEPKSEKEVPVGTVSRARATCPCCGAVLQPERVRAQLSAQHGGADALFDPERNRRGGARLLAVVTLRPGETGRHYRLPSEHDYRAVWKAQEQVKRILDEWDRGGKKGLCPVPDESTPTGGGSGAGRAFSVQRYGMLRWGDLFTARQKVLLLCLHGSVRQRQHESAVELLALVLDKLADKATSLCRWKTSAEYMAGNTFSRPALPIVWDFCEAHPFAGASGGWEEEVDWILAVVQAFTGAGLTPGQTQQADAKQCPLPNDSVGVFFTDPPYYDAIPYSDLADFFLAVARRSLPDLATHRSPLSPTSVADPKREEIVQDETKKVSGVPKNRDFFEISMSKAFLSSRGCLREDGIGSVVFAHKSTEGWEALLSGMLRGGWTITGSWPIATEAGSRLRARDSAALATSVHLVCRPRPEDAPVGDWGQVLAQLPERVGNWMERLQGEGVRGADLVFACIGPALEIFSRYRRVETAEGTEVALDKYLEKVWEVVGRTALEQILGTVEARARNGAAGALEEDARLTALFLWTLQSTSAKAGGEEASKSPPEDDEEPDEEAEDEDTGPKAARKGYSLVYDVVRRFAQPLGIQLPKWEGRIVDTEKGVVRLLPVAERAGQLFGEERARGMAEWLEDGVSKDLQLSLFTETNEAHAPRIRGRRGHISPAGEPDLRKEQEATTLDRVHAAMLLQKGGQANGLRALIKSEQERGPDFLRLANALSALYPKDSEEKRLLDAMLLAVPR